MKKEIKIDKSKLANIIINGLSVLGIVLTIYFSYKGYKIGIFTDPSKLEAFLKRAGRFYPLVFVLIQIIQTVIPIIPGAVTCPAGALIFGVYKGFLLNLIGIMIGSIANFFLARKYGRDLVMALIGKKKYDKYIKYLDDKRGFDKVFTFGMFFPISPADLLCMLAGLSNMSFKKYMLILSTGKPFTLFLYTYGLTEVIKFFGKIFLRG